jgi:hypothetical protein
MPPCTEQGPLRHLAGVQFASQQIFTGRRQLHVSAALVLRQPAALDREFEPGAEPASTALQLEQEGRVDPLDIDVAVLDGLDVGCELDELARRR